MRGALEGWGARWDGGPGRALRSLAVLGVAVAGLLYYRGVLDKVYALKDWAAWPILLLWAYGAFLSLACVSFGQLVVARGLGLSDLPPLESLVHSVCVGLVGFVLGMYGLGFLGLFRPVYAMALPAVMVIAGAGSLLALARRAMAAWRVRREAAEGATPLSRVIAALAAIFGVVSVTFVYLGAMTPDAINFDSAWSHLPIAQDYARHGRIVPFVADYTRNVPHLASIVHTWAWLVPGLRVSLRWMLALHDEFFFLLWTLVGIAAATRWLLGDTKVKGAWAAFFLFPAIFVYDSNLGGGADHYMALFSAPLLIATGRALEKLDARRCALAGVLAGGAILCKYQAVYLVLGAALAIAVRWAQLAARSRRPFAEMRGPLVLIGVGLLVTSPHFLKNWVFYGNPVYPFMQDHIASHPTTENAAFLFEYLFKDYSWRPHGTLFENLREGLGLFFSFSFKPHYSFTKNVPNYGSLFTLCLPFILFVRKPGRIAFGAVIGFVSLMMWALTFRVDRHLQSFTPVLAPVTAALLVRAWELGWLARAGVIPLVGLQLVWGGDAMLYDGQKRVDAAFALIRGGYDGKRADRFDYRRDFMQIDKALPKNAKILLHQQRRTLGIDRDVYLDIPGNQGLILYENVESPRSLWEFYRKIGITHILHSPGYKPANTKQEEILIAHLVRLSPGAKRMGPYEVVPLTAEPPPDTGRPYEVLTLGLEGYRDGLYPVTAMKAYEKMPLKEQRKFPAPLHALARDGAGVEALLARASAVVVGVKGKPTAAVTDELTRSFKVGTRYAKYFTLHLRDVGADAPAGDAASPQREPPEEEEQGEP